MEEETEGCVKWWFRKRQKNQQQCGVETAGKKWLPENKRGLGQTLNETWHPNDCEAQKLSSPHLSPVVLLPTFCQDVSNYTLLITMIWGFVCTILFWVSFSFYLSWCSRWFIKHPVIIKHWLIVCECVCVYVLVCLQVIIWCCDR